MTVLDDLGRVAEDLRKQGIDAVHDFLYNTHGCIEGLDVGDDFFPLWELSIPDNLDSLAIGDFRAILKRRGPDWTIEGICRLQGAAG
jgi:hypothetical protein